MKLKTLIALAVAGAFALPLAAQASADGDRMILAQAGGPAGSSATGTGPTTGSTAMDFSTLDKNSDGQISRAEWNAHMKSGSRGMGASGGATTGSSGSSTTGTTAGPGAASNKTGTGSATATTPSTSGQGKAQ